MRGRVLMALTLAAFILGGPSPRAHALFGRHKSNQPNVHRRSKKNAGTYAYLAPKKQKKPSGWYRSTLTGEGYGKPGKVKKK